MGRVDRTQLEDFLWWMSERQEIWHRRQRGVAPPWTTDDILQEYHFCNVHRELDHTTQFALYNILNREEPEAVFFNMVLFRFLNRPETYQKIGFHHPDQFSPRTAVRSLERLDQVFSPAYRVTTHGLDVDDVDFALACLPDDEVGSSRLHETSVNVEETE
jgi:hypothetical protein